MDQKPGSSPHLGHSTATDIADLTRRAKELLEITDSRLGISPEAPTEILRTAVRVEGHGSLEEIPGNHGFYRLKAAAFRALKEGKWSAESAATLTNEEFFEIIGIREMTAGKEPLIRKRDGCHRWKPEEFVPDNPRHGWTWEHCQADAVALLGSEDAVRKYVEGEQSKKAKDEKPDEPPDLFGQPLEPKQGRLFN